MWVHPTIASTNVRRMTSLLNLLRTCSTASSAGTQIMRRLIGKGMMSPQLEHDRAKAHATPVVVFQTRALFLIGK